MREGEIRGFTASRLRSRVVGLLLNTGCWGDLGQEGHKALQQNDSLIAIKARAGRSIFLRGLAHVSIDHLY